MNTIDIKEIKDYSQVEIIKYSLVVFDIDDTIITFKKNNLKNINYI